MDINLFSLAYSTEFENIGRFGTAVKYINYGTFDGADEFGNKTGEFGAGELAFILGYTNEFTENFYYGANAKVIYSSIEDKSSSAIGLDFGVNYEIPNQKMNLAATVSISEHSFLHTLIQKRIFRLISQLVFQKDLRIFRFVCHLISISLIKTVINFTSI